MAYGRETGFKMGNHGKGGGGFSLKSDMAGSSMKSGQKKPFGKSGHGFKGSLMGKAKAGKAARKKV